MRHSLSSVSRAAGRAASFVLGGVLALLVAAPPARAQDQPAGDTTSVPLAASASADTAVATVNAYQVYMACRNPDAIRREPAPEAVTLNAFCRRGLPARNTFLSADSVTLWLQAIPTAAEIEHYASESEKYDQDAVNLLRGAFEDVEGNDVSRGLIQFAELTAVLDTTEQKHLSSMLETVVAALAEGPAVGVLVRGYPDSTTRNELADRRTRLVADSLSARVGPEKVTLLPWTRADSAQYPPAGLYRRVTVHLLYPPRAAPVISSLGEIRFSPGETTLDAADFQALGQAAREIIAFNLPSDYPLIITGYAEGKDTKDPAAISLARQRAEVIREALAILLRNQISPDQMVARGAAVTAQAGNSQTGSGAESVTIALGNLPGPAITPAATEAASVDGAGGLLSVEGIATAAATVLVERAERQVQAYVFRLVASEVCGGYRDLLPQTCSMLFSPAGSGSYQLGLANLQQLVRNDFETLPSALLTRALVGRYGAELQMLNALATLKPEDLGAALPGDVKLAPIVDAAAADRLFRSALQTYPALQDSAQALWEHGGWALVGVYGVDFVRRVSRGDNLLEAAASFDKWVATTTSRHPTLGYLATSPPVLRVQRFTAFLADANEAATALHRRAVHAAAPDTVYLYAVRTALVNASGARRQSIAELASYVVQARRQFDAAAVVVDSIQKQLRFATGSGETAVQRRRELFAAGAGEVAGSFYTLLMDAPLTSTIRDSIARIATPVRNLLYALQTGDMRTAFTETVALLPRVVPPMVLDNCGALKVEGCTPLALQPQVLRLTAFAADISQSKSEDEMRDAMSRFLDQSSDVAIKRTGPPVRRIFANAFVTGSLEHPLDEEPARGYVRGSIQVPIGLEIVWRRSTGRPDWTRSLFLRMVDLGGFLPSESQEGSRNTDEVIASLVRPGIFGLLGARGGVPVTVGGGLTFTLTPTSEETEAETDREWEWKPRFSLFLGWDIPIFP